MHFKQVLALEQVLALKQVLALEQDLALKQDLNTSRPRPLSTQQTHASAPATRIDSPAGGPG